MALELNTDISQELNITARRNDSFVMQLQVSDPNNSNISYDLTSNQYGFVINGTTGGINYTNEGPMTVFQAKMTIKKANSEYETLNIYTYWWKEKKVANIIPSLIRTGNWSGEELDGNPETTGNANNIYAGIWLRSSTGAVGDSIYVNVPGEYMNIEPGQYMYDFQLRKRSNWIGNNSDKGAVYTTWLKGTFTIVDDITKQ